jgi:hypothetical protein
MNNFLNSLGVGKRQPRPQTQNNDNINNNANKMASNQNVLNQTGKNIYSSNQYSNVAHQHNSNIANKHNMSKNPVKTGVIPNEFNRDIVNNTHLDTPFQKNTGSNQQYIISPLSGEKMLLENFTHGNMQPSFRGSVNQNTKPYANQTILDNFTGSGEVYKNKVEVNRMFDMEKNVSNVNGAPSFNSEETKSYYITGEKRQNELPFHQVRVGQGLNRGYTADPSGGLNQANVREFVMPKDTNEIRSLDRPKLTYEGRIVAGLKEAQRGMVTTFKKQRPSRHYANNPDRYFKTGGAYKASKLRSEVYKKPTKRAQTRPYYGGPVSTWNKKTYKVPAIKKSSKHNYLQSWGRNLGREGAWKPNEDKAIGDYGKGTLEVKNNERDITQHRQHHSNIKAVIQALTVPWTDLLKETLKESFIGNYRPDGFFSANLPEKMTVYDPNDVARTTIKETTIDNSHSGHINAQLPSKQTTYDPNDTARTTKKETTIDNDHSGNISAQLPSKPTVYDPNDTTRTTKKETTIDNDHSGHVGAQLPSKPTVYDPNNIARTTIKETTVDNDHSGNMSAQLPSKLTVYDPNDVARTTIKEQVIDSNRAGNIVLPIKLAVYDPNHVAKTTIKEQLIHNDDPNINLVFTGPKKLTTYDPNDIPKTTTKETTIDALNQSGYIQGTNSRNMGYHIAEMMPKHTSKQFLSDYEYYGIADGDVGRGGGDGYLVNKYDAHNTNRQFLTDFEYGGIAGPTGPANARSYAAEYNATINSSREEVAQGRAPTAQGAKIANGSDKVNLQHKKIAEDIINVREPAENRFYSMPPQKNQCGMTKVKDELAEETQRDRISPEILDTFRSNPFTKPIGSVFGDRVMA